MIYSTRDIATYWQYEHLDYQKYHVWGRYRKDGTRVCFMNSFQRREGVLRYVILTLCPGYNITHSVHKLLVARAIYMKRVISSTCLKMDFKLEKQKLRICIFFSIEDQQFILYL